MLKFNNTFLHTSSYKTQSSLNYINPNSNIQCIPLDTSKKAVIWCHFFQQFIKRTKSKPLSIFSVLLSEKEKKKKKCTCKGVHPLLSFTKSKYFCYLCVKVATMFFSDAYGLAGMWFNVSSFSFGHKKLQTLLWYSVLPCLLCCIGWYIDSEVI